MRRMPLEQRRAELIDAAVRVIAREGLAAASIRAIVAEADMPLGSLHYVFESRDALIRELIKEVADVERVAVLARLDQSADGGLEELVRVGLGTFLDLLIANPERELAVLELALHGARHDPDLVTETWESYYDVAVQALEHGAALSGATWRIPVDQLARSVIASLDGITLNWLTSRDTEAARRHIDLLAKAFATMADTPDD